MLSRLFHTESFRLTAIFAGLMTGAMIVLMLLIFAIIHRAFQTELLTAADSDLASIQKGYQTEGVQEAAEFITQRLSKSGATDFFVLERADGRKIAGNLPSMSPTPGRRLLPMPAAQNGGRSREIIGKAIMLAPNLYAFAGRETYPAVRAEWQVIRAFIWVLVATLIIAIAGGMFLSRSFLGRVDAITRTCRSIMAGRLSERIAERGSRDEFDRLARTINAMLDRIGELMENVKQVSTDIAHDLRTPLTRLRNGLELVRQEGADVRSYEDAIERAIAESDTILSIFSALLRIAQIEGAPVSKFREVDLSGLLNQLADIFEPAAEDAGDRIEREIDCNIKIEGDRELLSQLFANLIENAIAHTPPGTEIRLELKGAGGRVIASVIDTGPGVPATERERVFRRFYRTEQSRSTPGSGLGLSLVSAIARLHGASVELQDNHPGLRVDVRFVAPAMGYGK